MHSDKKKHSAHSENPHSLQGEQERRIKALEEELARTKKQLHSLTEQNHTSQVSAANKTNVKSKFATSKANSAPHNVTQTTLVSKQAILDSLVNNTDEGILAVDSNFNIIGINQVLQKFLQNNYQIDLKEGDHLLSELADIRPDYHDRLVEHFGRTFKGERFRFDHMNEPQANWRYVEVTFSPLQDEEGNIIGGAHFVRDMTRKVEEGNAIKDIVVGSAQVSGEDYFEYLTNKLTQLFQAKYVYIGRLIEHETHIKTFALREMGKLIENLTYPVEGTPCQYVANKENTRYFSELTKIFPNDQKLQRWQAESYIGVPITTPSGESLGVLVLIDCQGLNPFPEAEKLLTIFSVRAGTELLRQEAEEHIRNKQEQLDRISRNVPEMIYEYVVHGDGTDEFVHVSSAANDIYELSPEAILADANLAWNAIHPEDLSKFTMAFQLSALNLDRFIWEGRLVSHKSGTEKWVKITSTPEKQQDEAIKWYGIIDNITRQKEYEIELELAKEKAERAARAKEEFLATMSHEIRTPLNAIVGLCDLLLKKSPKAEQIDNLKTLKYSSSSLMHLINDVLDFSKLEANKITLVEEDFNLRALLLSLEQAHQGAARNKKNTLEFLIADTVPTFICADEGKIAQVLNNLLSNAIKFTEQGEVVLSVDKLTTEAGSEELSFTISDTGIGIPSEKLNTIFEKFTQADSTTVRRFGGTGLGLSISKRLLELMESEIKVKSREHEGSVFSFSLKLKPSESLNSDSPAIITDTISLDVLPKLKLLIVEDEAVNRMVLTQFLQEWGISTEVAINGQEAIEMVQRSNYDIVLMDIRMPVMDGYTATEKIRLLPEKRFQELPIIAFTADITSTRQNEYSKLFTGFVTKPFNPDHLRDLLQQVSSGNSIQSSGLSVLFPVNLFIAEATFRGNIEKIRKFHQLSLKSLQEHKSEYLLAVEQQDEERLRKMIHKSKLLFSMLELDQFSQLLADQAPKVKNSLDESVSRQTIIYFEGIINQTSQRIAELG